MRTVILAAAVSTAAALSMAVAVPAVEAASPVPAVEAASPAPRPVRPTLTDLRAGTAPRTAAAGAPITISRPSTAGFSALGVTWAEDPAAGDVEVAYRTRLGSGPWTAWSGAGTDDNQPDPADLAGRRSARGGTEPEWTGPATGVEARITVRSGAVPRDLKLTLIDPGTSPADPTAAAATTQAAGRPAILSRARWGADPRLMTWDPEYAPSIRAGFLHHTAGTNNYTQGQVPAILRSIYAFHAQTRGWGDIGYNFLVDRFGRIWEGRAGGVDSTVIGAHTGGFNTGTFGIAMMGTFQTTAVPAFVTSAVSAVFAWKFARWRVNPTGTVRLTSGGGGTSRYPRGTVVTKNTVSGHRDVGRTECPGDRGYATLATIRARAKALIGSTPAVTAPAATPSAVGYGTGTVRVTARLTATTAWTVRITRDCPAAAVRSWSGTGTSVGTTWDLRDSAGRVVRPGTYTVTVFPAGSATGAGKAARLTVRPPAAVTPPATGAPASAGPAGFVPVAPVRVLDSRTAALPAGGGTRLDARVVGVGGVPATGVSAVLVSATGLCSTATGPLTLFPAGTTRPRTSSVSLPAGNRTDSAAAAVRVGAGGRISVAGGAGSADVALDVVGYLPGRGGAGLHPVRGTRVLDATIPAGGTRTLTLPAATVPASATAVLANLAAVTPAAAGALRVWPAGAARPAPGNLIFAAGVTSSDRVAVGLRRGALALQNGSSRATRVVLDVTGWYGRAGARFTAVAPVRLAAPAVPAGGTVSVRVRGRAGVPTAATAVVASLSGRGARRTWLAAWGSGSRPGTADLHTEAGTWETTLVVVPLAAGGTVALFSASAAATATLDVVGWYR